MKIKTESHVDHFPANVIDFVAEKFASREGFFIESFELPEEFGDFQCHLHGPASGTSPVGDDEAQMLPREGRDFLHRMCDRAPVMTRMCTVIAGPHEGETVLYTAYPGPCAPKSPLDPTLRDDEREASVAFWAEHALSN